MKRVSLFIALAIIAVSCSSKSELPLRGWNILSTNYENAVKVIESADQYDINHLQLSHDLVMDLRHMRDTARCERVNSLIDLAHQKGIEEVVLWDHALYHLSYYPEEFRTGPKGTIDLDNPLFWEWFKEDYREMLTLVPAADGLVLTFIETGARAEKQHSVNLTTAADKLAAVIDAVADVVCEERGKKLYIRTFAYTEKEYEDISGCLAHVENQDIILMMKETPHDFFLTHPDNSLATQFDRPTIMEFDAGNEFNGQGVIINTWPEHFMRRWDAFRKIDNVVGYVARTDRYGTTHVIDSPSEILLYTLKRYTEDESVTSDQIYDEFITARYGAEALPFVKPAFQSSFDIITSVMYTLGSNSACHSGLNFEPYQSSYNRHVSGKWIDPPVVFVEHNVNREFHYWSDIVEHLSPARFKRPTGMLKEEFPRALAENWVTPEEKINSDYIQYVYTEKCYGVDLAEKALAMVQQTKGLTPDNRHQELIDIFERTLLTAKIHRATFSAILAFRLYVKEQGELDAASKEILDRSLDEIPQIAEEIEQHEAEHPIGQWNWRNDAREAMKYYTKITADGWSDYNNSIYTR